MRVGIVGDLHSPFTHPRYFDFIVDTFEKQHIEEVLFIGDIADNHAISYHESDPDGFSPGNEIKITGKKLERWHKRFPNALVTVGNHDILPERKLFTLGLPKAILRDYSEIWNVPSWNFVPEVDIEGVRYVHGMSASGINGARNLALKSRQSVVMGHCHSFGGIQYIAGNRDIIFGMNVGCGVDIEAYAMAYGKSFPLKPTLGCGIVINGTRGYFIPMEFPKYSRR
jgi:predicted phosphodiesterase